MFFYFSYNFFPIFYEFRILESHYLRVEVMILSVVFILLVISFLLASDRYKITPLGALRVIIKPILLAFVLSDFPWPTIELESSDWLVSLVNGSSVGRVITSLSVSI